MYWLLINEEDYYVEKESLCEARRSFWDAVLRQMKTAQTGFTDPW